MNRETVLEQSLKALDYGLVSIIMPNYNCAAYLRETVDSVISQTYKNWELLFVDDCSTDDSLEIINSYNDERIKVFKNPCNSGAAASRNYALREAKGDWIAFLDSDDIWLENKLEHQLTFMTENGYKFSFTGYVHIDENSKSTGKVVVGPKKVGRRKMYRYNYLGCLTVMYDAKHVGVIQVDERLQSRNDYAMWLKVCHKCDCYYLDEFLSKYRIHSNSLSHSGLKKSLKNQYLLLRLGESKSVVGALYHTAVNIFFGVLKKIFYVKAK